MMARSKTRSSFLEPIPFDLVIEILLKLPAKSIARLRCVSKLWDSTFRSSYFTESFFTISSSRTKLLFVCLKDGETFFFSSAHHQDQNLSSSSIAAKTHMTFPINCPSDVCRPVRGLVCGLNQRTTKGITVSVPLICNPSTGESFALPRVKTRRKGVISFLGYDPIDKVFKVLCMTHVARYSGFEQHQVLTLETGKKPFWKMIKCGILHAPHPVEHESNGFPLYDGICINGVLYYLAKLRAGYGCWCRHVVCFDIRSEEFSYVKKDQGMELNWGIKIESTLINYKGKLAMLQPIFVYNYRKCTGVQVWVLEDAEKHQSLRYIYLYPPPWKNIFEGTKLCFVGTTATGEIVLSPNTIHDSFYLFYYSPERNTMIKVDIQGMEAFKRHKVHTFLDHVEDVKLVSSRIMGS